MFSMFLSQMLIGGIVCIPQQHWQESSYVVKLKEILEEIWKSDSCKQYTSAIGCLSLMSDNLLYPKLITKNEKGEIVMIKIENEPISLIELNLSDEEINEIKSSGFLVVSKYER